VIVSTVVLGPTRPHAPEPQHFAEPFCTTHVPKEPVARPVTPEVKPEGVVGGMYAFPNVLVFEPTRPSSFSPQHRTPPVLVRTQVWPRPPLINTCMGAVTVDEFLVDPVDAPSLGVTRQ